MSELLALGISHKTAPVALRERVALSEREQAELISSLVGGGEADEAVIVSTCNRIEAYLVAPDPVAAETALLSRLARHAGIPPTELAGAIYTLRNCDAARHLYRVTAGLDSMVVGETEIQGQVRRAYEAALEVGLTGPLTNRLFHAAIATGKRVRTETGVSDGHLSVPSVAIALARQALGGLGGRDVVVLGAGETAELAAQALAHEGVRTIFIANRHRDRALSLARRFAGEAVRLDDLPAQLERADAVVSATASPHAVLGAEELEQVMRARGGRPLVLIDLAVPRDIDPACADLAGVTLHDLDDIGQLVERNRSVREAEAARGEELVEEEIRAFAEWLGGMEIVPTIAALRAHGARIVADVLAENAGRWEQASERDLERIEAISRTVVNRLLHEPTLRLKDATQRNAHAQAHVLRELFGLSEEAPVLPPEEAQPKVTQLPSAGERRRRRAR